MQPFEGIRVLDLTHVLAGPFCTFQLANLGAEVIKIESPALPDMTRDDGSIAELNEDLIGTLFQAQSAGKKSVALDLKTAAGRDVFMRLVKSADVLVQNYSGEKIAALGLDYDALAAVNPRLIYCSMTGFGRTGPKAEHPAYDVVIQAFSGIMMANGWSPGDPPLRVGPPMVDYGTGAQAAFAVSAALFQRERTGEGQQIDVAMTDAALMLMSSHVTDTLATGAAPRPFGNAHPTMPYYSAYETADGWIMLGAYTIRQCADLMQALDCPAEAAALLKLNRASIGTLAARTRPLIAARMKEKSAQEWEDLLNAAHVPAARVRRIEETLAEPQITSRGVLQGHGGAVAPGAPQKLPVAAFSYANDGPRLGGPPPRLGADTHRVLSELGYSEGDIADLLARGICA